MPAGRAAGLAAGRPLGWHLGRQPSTKPVSTCMMPRKAASASQRTLNTVVLGWLAVAAAAGLLLLGSTSAASQRATGAAAEVAAVGRHDNHQTMPKKKAGTRAKKAGPSKRQQHQRPGGGGGGATAAAAAVTSSSAPAVTPKQALPSAPEVVAVAHADAATNGQLLTIDGALSSPECEQWVAFAESLGLRSTKPLGGRPQRGHAYRDNYRAQVHDTTGHSCAPTDALRLIPAWASPPALAARTITPWWRGGALARAAALCFCESSLRCFIAQVHDSEIAVALWRSGLGELLGRSLPPLADGRRAVGFNDNIRLYRYDRGLRFGKHYDTSDLDSAGAASVASFLTAVFTEIYLCHACSYQEILIRNGRG
jgi:hypothetical protein